MTIKLLSNLWLKAFIIALLAAIFVQAFFLKSYIVYSDSVEDISTGSRIFVNKSKYGIRTPVTWLTIPFLHRKIPFTEKACYSEGLQTEPYRIGGSKIKRFELLVFNFPLETNYPIDKRSVLLRRCIGLPGETIKIIDKIIYINNQKTTSVYQKKLYQIIVLDTVNLPSFLKKTQLVYNKNYPIFNAFLTKKQRAILDTFETIINISPINKQRGYATKGVFPYIKRLGWNKDNMGPLKIPQKNETVKLTHENYRYYRTVIKNETGDFRINNQLFFINGKQTDKYTFKQDYYFVMSDNHDCFEDSRHWGFIPANHIIGTPLFTWFENKNYE